MNIQIRPISADELERFLETMGVPFFFDVTPQRTERFQHAFELERLRAAFDGEQMVATFGALSLSLSVPGGTLPTAGTTVVTVLPTHRRQGVLRALMADHFAEVQRAGEPLAALWASESSIYGRFVYGPSSERAVMQLEKPFARMQQPTDIRGTMRLVDRDEAAAVFPRIYEQLLRQRPGTFHRNDRWWEHRVLSDPEFARGPWQAQRRVVHLRDGEPAGYAIYRTRAANAEVSVELQVVELIGMDAAAQKALWQYLLGIDLVTSISYPNQPIDDPLRWWLAEPRRMQRTIEDAMWVRPVDVLACLRGRRYGTAGRLGLRMHDPLCAWNEGTFQLETDRDGVARCERVQAASAVELELTPYALGAAYLGAHRFRDLARAGLASGSAQALELADAIFSWDPLPWCQEVF